jgi:hypothetical protein
MTTSNQTIVNIANFFAVATAEAEAQTKKAKDAGNKLEVLDEKCQDLQATRAKALTWLHETPLHTETYNGISDREVIRMYRDAVVCAIKVLDPKRPYHKKGFTAEQITTVEEFAKGLGINTDVLPKDEGEYSIATGPIHEAMVQLGAMGGTLGAKDVRKSSQKIEDAHQNTSNMRKILEARNEELEELREVLESRNKDLNAARSNEMLGADLSSRRTLEEQLEDRIKALKVRKNELSKIVEDRDEELAGAHARVKELSCVLESRNKALNAANQRVDVNDRACKRVEEQLHTAKASIERLIEVRGGPNAERQRQIKRLQLQLGEALEKIRSLEQKDTRTPEQKIMGTIVGAQKVEDLRQTLETRNEELAEAHGQRDKALKRLTVEEQVTKDMRDQRDVAEKQKRAVARSNEDLHNALDAIMELTGPQSAQCDRVIFTAAWEALGRPTNSTGWTSS